MVINFMENPESQKLQSDQRTTKQVRIDEGLHKLLKIKAAESGMAIRELLEECLAEFLGTDE
jgi:predicted HicB family RNase H-like nuclease